MNVLVVGAAGRTGGLLVNRALQDGHTVTALARNPSRIAARPGLIATRGDVRDAADLAMAMAGQHAVTVALGVQGRGATTVFSEGLGNIVAAAQAAGTRRLMVMSSAGLSTDHLPFIQRHMTHLVATRVYGQIHADLARMEEIVVDSGLDWTIVRVPMLKDGEPTSTYQVSIGGHLDKAGTAIRADVADWIVRNLAEPATYRQRVEMAS
ncbi:NAD(P)-dependent oxidoreductase [Nocardia sp. SYP-A9097]|uniref:NAD(P)-dependent oxidoreductase n=1 Tax=Nocardia sp. SYP-A9097 TaxID=2663237 RepID=UPI001891B75F|nr:NAD(P)H-binding protein [Nocardia sp. SYP-A9097]